MYLLIVFLPLLGSSVAGFFGRFLGSEGSAILTTTCVSFFALVGFLFLFRIYYFRLKGPLREILNLFLVFFIAVVISLIRIKVIHLLGGQALPLLEPIIWAAVGGGALPSTGPNGAESSSTWKEDPFELRVLEESFSDSPPAGESQTEESEPSVNRRSLEAPQTEEGEPSVNRRGPEEAGPALPANPVPSGGDEAGPSVPYPYRRDEMIGGDSVEAIERRLLAQFAYPSYEDIQLAHIQAEDLFEVKVEIVKVMAGLDPTGDWMGRGARALDNPRTATGEHSLEQLYRLLSALNERGKEAPEFKELKNRVFLKKGGPGGDSIA
nr:hypothetical protein [Brassica napus]UUC04466.1 hypothetical protein [Brassica napus]UUC04541.1 hypothetical protein [Brassica napus]